MEATLTYLLCPDLSQIAATESVYLIPAEDDWAQSVRRVIDRVSGGEFYVIVYERRWRQVVRSLMAGRISLRGPTYSQLLRHIQQLGVTVHSRFAVWPNASEPRIAYPHKDHNVARYLQWAGLIGGGRLFLLKLLGRTLPLTWTHLLFPAEVLIVRKNGLDKK